MRNPYVTGSYVVGQNYYGRDRLIDILLYGEGRANWVVGNQSIGKTSLLRQLELLADADVRLTPLYWDMQGCTSFAFLGRHLSGAVQDNAKRFGRLGMTDMLMREEDVLAALANLRRAAMRANRELLLLCDETEVLLDIAAAEPRAMQRLHKELTGGAGLRAVFVSTRRIYGLHDVCRNWPTSAFLAGFDMSHMLGSLDARPTRSLILRSQGPRKERVHAEPQVIESVMHATNNHPMLVQVLCSRLFREDGLLAACCTEDLQVSPQMAEAFESDFRHLTPADRAIITAVHNAVAIEPAALRGVTTDRPSELSQRVRNLETLGYLRRKRGRLAIGNLFLASWLATQSEALKKVPSGPPSEADMRAVFARNRAHDRESVRTQLNARRSRLVELEAVRARELTDVAPQVLSEIEQLQIEIAELRKLIDRR